MRLYLIRHGQSFNNYHEGSETVQRVSDPPLTEVGVQQAAHLAQHLMTHSDPFPVFDPSLVAWEGHFQLTRIWVSPMMRALQTALPLATATRIAPEVWDDIHEVGGIWLDDGNGGYVGHAGMSRAEMLQTFPTYRLPPSITERGWWNRDRESIDECKVRSASVVKRILSMAAAHPDDIVALVAHQAFLGLMLRAFMGIVSDGIWMMHYNTGYSRIDISEEAIRIRYLNRIDHLPFNYITT